MGVIAMKNYIFLFHFLILSSTSLAQIGYKNYYLTEPFDSIAVKLENTGIKYVKYDEFKHHRIKMVNGKLVPSISEFKAIFDNSKSKPFIAQITCTRIDFEEDDGINVTFYFHYKNILMEIVVGDIEIDFEVLKDKMIRKYGEPINNRANKIEFRIPKFETIIELGFRTTPYVTYKDTALINSHFLKQYKEQKLAADKELKRIADTVHGF